jgi:hypothetical protein
MQLNSELHGYGEVQGPMPKEPDEKVDPSSNKANNLSTASTGIRRLYVLDSNNFIIVVFNLQIDDFICSITNFFLSNDNNNNDNFKTTFACNCNYYESKTTANNTNAHSNSSHTAADSASQDSLITKDASKTNENKIESASNESIGLAEPETALKSTSSRENITRNDWNDKLNNYIYLIILFINITFMLMCISINKLFIYLVRMVYHVLKWDNCFICLYLLLLSLPVLMNLFSVKITTQVKFFLARRLSCGARRKKERLILTRSRLVRSN